MKSGLRAYKTIGVESLVETANPHQLVSMLLRGLLDRLASASGAIHAGDVEHKGRSLSEAISIIDSLRASIDMERGGELAENLASLYDFVEGHLVQANIDSDLEKLAEARAIVNVINDGWNEIPEEVRHAARQ